MVIDFIEVNVLEVKYQNKTLPRTVTNFPTLSALTSRIEITFVLLGALKYTSLKS